MGPVSASLQRIMKIQSVVTLSVLALVTVATQAYLPSVDKTGAIGWRGPECTQDLISHCKTVFKNYSTNCDDICWLCELCDKLPNDPTGCQFCSEGVKGCWGMCKTGAQICSKCIPLF